MFLISSPLLAYIPSVVSFVFLIFLASWHSLLVKLKALKIAQPDLESLVMEHHLKDCIDGSFAGAARLAEHR